MIVHRDLASIFERIALLLESKSNVALGRLPGGFLPGGRFPADYCRDVIFSVGFLPARNTAG